MIQNMLYQFAREIESYLLANGFPVAVYYGPQRMTRTDYQSRVVIFPDTVGGDVPPHNPLGTGRKLATDTASTKVVSALDQAVLIQIYGECSESGAMIHEHESIVMEIVDAVVVCMFEAASGSHMVVGERPGTFRFNRARWLPNSEIYRSAAEAEVLPGRAYELRALIPRAINKRPYQMAEIQASETTVNPGSNQVPTPVAGP